jgi:undecaprenyl-diphosphatase
MTFLQALILGIIEGITEFLPVSSTGHMILANYFMGIEEDPFTKMFVVAIQFGAILSVVVLYWRKFFDFSRIQFYIKLFIAVIPALVLGLLFNDAIEALLESPLTVSVMLILGGVVLLFIDRAFKNQTITEEPQIPNKRAFIIGLWQCLAMMPGVSRSAASIIGGMQQKLTRKLAAEFSFFLAVPTMAAASLYSLMLKNWTVEGSNLRGYELIMQGDNLLLFIVGAVVSFIVAMIAIKSFIHFLQRYGFKMFGYYRIAVGLIMLFILGVDYY